MNSKLIKSFLVNCLILSIPILFPFFSFSGELKEKLIAYWSFDKGSGDEVTDDSGNGRNGTIVGPKWASGKFGSALEFDGVDDYVDLAKTSATLFDGIAEFTITAWVKPVHKNTNDWPAILQKYQGSVRTGLLRKHSGMICLGSDTTNQKTSGLGKSLLIRRKMCTAKQG